MASADTLDACQASSNGVSSKQLRAIHARMGAAVLGLGLFACLLSGGFMWGAYQWMTTRHQASLHVLGAVLAVYAAAEAAFSVLWWRKYKAWSASPGHLIDNHGPEQTEEQARAGEDSQSAGSAPCAAAPCTRGPLKECLHKARWPGVCRSKHDDRAKPCHR